VIGSAWFILTDEKYNVQRELGGRANYCMHTFRLAPIKLNYIDFHCCVLSMPVCNDLQFAKFFLTS